MLFLAAQFLPLLGRMSKAVSVTDSPLYQHVLVGVFPATLRASPPSMPEVAQCTFLQPERSGCVQHVVVHPFENFLWAMAVRSKPAQQ